MEKPWHNEPSLLLGCFSFSAHTHQDATGKGKPLWDTIQPGRELPRLFLGKDFFQQEGEVGNISFGNNGLSSEQSHLMFVFHIIAHSVCLLTAVNIPFPEGKLRNSRNKLSINAGGLEGKTQPREKGLHSAFWDFKIPHRGDNSGVGLNLLLQAVEIRFALEKSSQSSGMVWGGKDHKAHPVPPPPMGRDSSH